MYTGEAGETADMPWLAVWSAVLATSLWGATGAESVVGAAVKQEVEDIFRKVQQFMGGAERPDSKSVGSRMKNVYDYGSGEDDYADDPGVAPRAPATPGAFPIGIVMADDLYPLVVGKHADSGRPFVTDVDKRPALVVAAAGGDYKLLIPFPVVVGDHPQHPQLAQHTQLPQLARHYQSFRQYSAEPAFVEDRDRRPRPPEVKPRPDKVLAGRPGPAVLGYTTDRDVAGPTPPRKTLPVAYRQPQHQQSYHPPVNYDGAYASVPADFRPSPFLGNITDDPPGRSPKPQSHYDSYDEQPNDFTEQDYIDSLNSPGAHASIGGVHHVTHHADDYLGKIYEDMYYRTPPPRHPRPNHPQSSIDRKGNQEYFPVRQDIKAPTSSGSNKTEISRQNISNRKNVKQKEDKQINMSTNNTSSRNR